MPQVGIYSQNEFASLDGLAYTNTGRNLKTWWNFEDFIDEKIASGSSIWFPTYAGAGALVFDDIATFVRPGILSLTTGTTNAGIAAIIHAQSSLSPFLFGAGEYTFETDIYIPLLSTAIEEYVLRIGFGDLSGADFNDGAYFEYNRSATGDSLVCCTASGGTRTKTSIGWIAAGQWIRLKIFVNRLGTQVDFSVNGPIITSNTTNIPTGAGRNTSGIFHIVKTAGITPRTFNVDWVWEHFDLNASR